MTELEKLCEEALYETMSEEKDGKSLVKDNSSGNLYFRKRLSVFNLQVFEYLKDHRSRHIPRIIQFWQDGEQLVVIEELIQGRTLDEVLSAGDADEQLSFEERVRILTEICDGLQFLHDANPPIIHRDLKASNIMVTEDGSVKIIDYDAAKIYVEGQEKDTVLIGTQGLAAPEQYGFAQSNVRTDLYALGKLVERMLPENEDARRIAERATEMDPKKRYASARQMKEQIRRIREKVPSLDKKLEHLPGYDSQNRAHRLWARVFLVLVTLAVIGAAAVYVIFFRVLPQKRLAESNAALQVVGDTFERQEPWQTQAEELKTFLGAYPYSELTQEQQKVVRGYAETIMESCLLATSSGINLDNLCVALGELTGEEKTWEYVRSYAEIRILRSKKRYEDAVESMKALWQGEGSSGGASGASAADSPPDYEEHLEALCEEILAKGQEKEALFDQTKTSANLVNTLNLYVLIKEDYEPGREAYESVYRNALEIAEADVEQGHYDEALALYNTLAGYDNVTDTDFEVIIPQTTYQKAESLSADGQYRTAYELFSGIAEFRDAQDRADECAYMWGRTEMESGKYAEAIKAFELIPGHNDADSRLLDAKYAYCDEKKERPDDKTYEYLTDLSDAGYAGTDALRNEVYTWHAEIQNGVEVSIGAYQAVEVRATLYGGPPDGSTTVRFEIIDHVNGRSSSWSDGEEYSRGQKPSSTYYKDDISWNLFEREHTVNVYDGNGRKIGTWTGQFSLEFLK